MADDTMSRLSSLLSDEESVRQIAELAEMFRSGEVREDDGQESEIPDISSLAGIAGLAGAMQQPDRNTELLNALRPHLGEERQRKLDKAVKLLRIVNIIGIAKESGLIEELL